MGLGGYAISQDASGAEFDTDRYGSDIREINLREGEGYQVCAQACMDEPQCQAWTWVPTGVQTHDGPNCWLKGDSPETGRVAGLVSGLRGRGLIQTAATPVSTGSGNGSWSQGGTSGQMSTTTDPQLVLFDGDNFQGRGLRLDRDASNLHLETLEFGDHTWSLAANGRWEVCEHIEFDGECRVYEGDHAQLADFGGTISSVRYLGPGAPSRILNPASGSMAGQVAGQADQTGPRQPGIIESAAERAARVAAEEAERRAHDRIREGIGRIF